MSVRYRKNPETAGRIIDGLAFIITPDDSRLHTLNATATHIWQLSAEGITEEQAARALAERFEVDETTALADVRECVLDLINRQILLAE